MYFTVAIQFIFYEPHFTRHILVTGTSVENLQMKLSSDMRSEICLRYFLHLQVRKRMAVARYFDVILLILEVNYVLKLYTYIQMNYAFTQKALKNMRSLLTLPSR
jgi:hypothetical protein